MWWELCILWTLSATRQSNWFSVFKLTSPFSINISNNPFNKHQKSNQKSILHLICDVGAVDLLQFERWLEPVVWSTKKLLDLAYWKFILKHSDVNRSCLQTPRWKYWKNVYWKSGIRLADFRLTRMGGRGIETKINFEMYLNLLENDSCLGRFLQVGLETKEFSHKPHNRPFDWNIFRSSDSSLVHIAPIKRFCLNRSSVLKVT